MADDVINIEVAYATALRQEIITLQVQSQCTIELAISASGILALFPEIELTQQKVGIFSQVCSLQHLVSEGDRIEIYRPLLQNPMEARRNRLNKS